MIELSSGAIASAVALFLAGTRKKRSREISKALREKPPLAEKARYRAERFFVNFFSREARFFRRSRFSRSAHEILFPRNFVPAKLLELHPFRVRSFFLIFTQGYARVASSPWA